MRFRWLGVILALVTGSTATAQDYGGGWAVPTLDTASQIVNQSIITNMMVENIKRQNAGGSRTSSVRVPNASTGRVGQPMLFASALQSGGGESASVDTSFRRNAATTREAEQNILRALAKRQPAAVSQYEKHFRQHDMARAFDSIVGEYGLRSNDAADALTAYWVMTWVVANRAPLPPRDAVQAARAQVGGGFARTSVGEFDAKRRQILADEAIFNFLVLNQVWRNVSKGGGASGDFRKLSDATQSNFIPLGADLRSLTLGRGGFSRR